MKPMYNTETFVDVYGKVSDFKTDYTNIDLGGLVDVTDTENPKHTSLLTKLYYLLYAKFGNSPIANMDVNQFKYKLFGIIFQYGPTWEKKLNIQSDLRALEGDNLFKGTSAIYNSALNPEQTPKTGDLTELEYINSQNTTNYKKSKMDAYGELWSLLATDVTEEFLERFRPLFKVFVRSERPILYIDEED